MTHDHSAQAEKQALDRVMMAVSVAIWADGHPVDQVMKQLLLYGEHVYANGFADGTSDGWQRAQEAEHPPEDEEVP